MTVVVGRTLLSQSRVGRLTGQDFRHAASELPIDVPDLKEVHVVGENRLLLAMASAWMSLRLALLSVMPPLSCLPSLVRASQSRRLVFITST